jgi:polar amino acid transport system substrate-binding protein
MRRILSLLLLLVSVSGLTQELTAGSVEWEPFQRHDGQEVSGIVPDMLTAISAQTGIRIRYVPEPMKRMLVDFRNGKVQLDPMSNPAWRFEDADMSVFSDPYLSIRDVVLMMKKDAITATSVHDFFGRSIGCELGFAYADGFDEAFRAGDIQRQDVASGARANLMRLTAGRVNAIIINELVADYWITELGMRRQDFAVAFAFSGYSDLQLRLHKSQAEMLPAINDAIAELQADGTINDIIKRYIY